MDSRIPSGTSVKHTLAAGVRLSHYEIKSQLGAGGMGEVYIAVDVELGRTVAIKILPAGVASEPHRVQRFIQEAKAASALNHPNILTIHEIGTEAGARFIATEFIDGETLRRHIARAPLTMTEAIDIAIQVASALSTAHAAGIVHRDVKPENIMLRRDGIVKVLDFGLAKLTERWRADEVDQDAATKAMVETEPGVVMGTTAYMSPEQARGLQIDTRTDIWSVGVVLYEMITGRAPFKSETASDTNAAILKTEVPALSQQVPEVPAELDRIVRKALQKDREERYQVIKDLLLDLKSLKRDLDLSAASERSGMSQTHEQQLTGLAQKTNESTVTVSTQASALTQQLGLHTNARWLWLVPMVLIAFLIAGGWYWWRQRNEAQTFANLTVTQLVSRKNELGELRASHARFSPDGKFVAYASMKGVNSNIWLKQVGSGEPFANRSEPGTAASPIWSPDGLQIAFLSNREGRNSIWIMPAFGGPATQLKSLDNTSRALVAWSRGGTIYFEMQTNLYALNLASQEISQLTSFDPSKPMDRGFSLSPDEQSIAYTDNKDAQIDIYVMPKRGGPAVRITNDKAEDSAPVWTPDGRRILYSSNRNGVKQIFLGYADGRAPVQLTVNDNGSDVLDVSPDSAKILYASARDESDLWSVKLDRPKEVQVTSDIAIELWPDVALDGGTIAFQSTRASTGANLFNCLLLAKSLTSDTAPTQLASDGFAPRWSPDGNLIAFLRYANASSNLWIVHATGGDAKPLTTSGVTFGGFTLLPYNRVQTQDFQWSPDSRRLAYCSSTSGVANVWQTSADGSGATPLSDNNAPNLYFFNPAWSPDGQQVAWLALAAGRGDKKTSWSIWVAAAGKGQQIFESDSLLGLVGWSQSGQELVVKSMASKSNSQGVPSDVSLFTVALGGGAARPLAQLKTAYFQNIQLAPARNQIAFVTRQDATDSLQVVPASGGTAKTLITSNDPRVYFSGLVWSPDGKTIYYGKQASWSVLSMIDHFK